MNNLQSSAGSGSSNVSADAGGADRARAGGHVELAHARAGGCGNHEAWDCADDHGDHRHENARARAPGLRVDARAHAVRPGGSKRREP